MTTCTILDAEILSFGGGVNSTALAILLVNRGWRGHIVFSDTSCEHPETYCYMRMFEAEWLQPRGLEITVLKGMPWQRMRGGIGLVERCERDHLIPMPAVRWCTYEYKSEPLARYAEHIGAERMLIGIAADEAHRQKDRICPLVDEGITRKGCIEIIKAEGLDVPQKSGCYICPFMRTSQWRELWERHPDLYERAARLEELSSEKRGRFATFDPDGKRTLRDLARGFSAQSTMFDPDDWEGLMEYKPCMCTL